jgi:isocitrate/isopropylmalate dehydrogenase
MFGFLQQTLGSLEAGRPIGDGKLLEAARAIDAAVDAVCRDGKTLTYDLGGTAKCSEVGAAIAERVRRG